MLVGVLCARPKPWILGSISGFLRGSTAHLHHQWRSPLQLAGSPRDPPPLRRRHHSSSCRLGLTGGGAASIWHAILPSGCADGDLLPRPAVQHDLRLGSGDGSWNVAWDARPARWLHRRDSAWLLFGVCACLAPVDCANGGPVPADADEDAAPAHSAGVTSSPSHPEDGSPPDYRVTGVVADGRCLFRAIAHCACLRNGEEAPDENHQRELADELRAQVVEELLKRREEVEWFIEEDFDAYVKRIQEPYVWGGEPELLMASHVLKTQISVFMIDRKSGGLVNIAKYGEEYCKDKTSPIDVLFHGYGHYDILETFSDQCSQKITT